jgi:predicted AAA+ superfamily ATPase
MKSITRQIAKEIQNDCFKGKVILLLGARQVGKSTLIKMLPFDKQIQTLWLDGENADVHLLLENANSERLKQIAGNHKVIVIDEAQKINAIGSILKLFSDYHKDIQVIASGSSSFGKSHQFTYGNQAITPTFALWLLSRNSNRHRK